MMKKFFDKNVFFYLRKTATEIHLYKKDIEKSITTDNELVEWIWIRQRPKNVVTCPNYRRMQP